MGTAQSQLSSTLNETIDFEIPGIGARLLQHFGRNTTVFSRGLRSIFTLKKESCYKCSSRTYIEGWQSSQVFLEYGPG